jgi:hypothetical protein
MAEELAAKAEADAAKPGKPEVTKPSPKAAKKLVPGDVVNVVSAKGTHLSAQVIAVRSDKRVDLSFEFNGADMTITSSPHDPTGTQPDSWHLSA